MDYSYSIFKKFCHAFYIFLCGGKGSRTQNSRSFFPYADAEEHEGEDGVGSTVEQTHSRAQTVAAKRGKKLIFK